MALRTNTLQSPAYTSTAASSSSLVTPSLTLLADPPIRLADGAALDYLMIEMVGVLRESAGVANERVRRVEREMKEAGLVDATSGAGKEKGKKEGRESIGVGVPGGGAGGTRSRVSSIAGMSTVGDVASPAPAGHEESDEEESVRTRLEAIGLHIGGNVAERFVMVFVVFVFELYELIRVFLGVFVCGIGYVGTVRGLGIRLML